MPISIVSIVTPSFKARSYGQDMQTFLSIGKKQKKRAETLKAICPLLSFSRTSCKALFSSTLRCLIHWTGHWDSIQTLIVNAVVTTGTFPEHSQKSDVIAPFGIQPRFGLVASFSSLKVQVR